MATLLQTLGFFSDIFDFFLPFLLVFAVIYALLLKTKFLTEDPNLNAAISFAIALIVALSGAGKFLMNLAPFMATLFMVVFFMLLIFLFFNVKLEEVLKIKSISLILIFISIIFVFYVLGQMIGQQVYEAGVGNATSNATHIIPTKACDFETVSGSRAIVCIISHPKFLGAITLLGLLAVATFFVVYVPKS
ncbi:MAG: hypothetical protein J7K22_02575 [Nanoarchaeota archaeon]|nr:hypothetical protein [Nanoarchaeota archaeon]